MGELRERMKRDMEIRGFSPHTQLAYLRRVAALTRYLGRAPDRVGLDEIQRYQLYLVRERKVAGNASTSAPMTISVTSRRSSFCLFMTDLIRGDDSRPNRKWGGGSSSI